MVPPTVPDAWISKYIFPGGDVPSLSETLAAIEPSRLWVTDIEILRVHYAETLKHWFDRFEDQRAQVAALYDERFCRMWEFYLAACEMLFRNGPLMVFHLQLAQRRDAVPLTRDYITDFDHRVRRRGSARRKAPPRRPAVTGLTHFDVDQTAACAASAASRSNATMLVILIIGLTAGPAVSL